MADSSNPTPQSHSDSSILRQENAEERFRLLVDSVKDYAIFIMDNDGYIQSWNKGAERIKGYKEKEIIGKHFSLFYTMEDINRNHPQNELQLAKLNGKYEEEGWRVRKNGSTFWANIIITPITDAHGNQIGFAKVTRDLTERKEAEEKLRASEERHRRMFENIKDYAMIMLDEKGIISSWNEGARRIYGFESHEVLGKSVNLFYTQQDLQIEKADYEIKEAGETGRFEDEGWRIRKDGTKFWANVLINAIRDSQGKVIGFSKVTQDITDKKRAHDLLRMSYANLEKRVEERTNELMKANKELQDAIRARDEFLSIASHELRTPLTPLKLQIQNLISSVNKKTIHTMPDDRLERMASTCERSVSRLTVLVDSLLDVSRINTGKVNLHFETMDLSEMAQELYQRFKPEIDRTESTVTLDAPKPVIGAFDKLRMEQVFINLLTNSLKYGNNNPVSIRVFEENGWAMMVFTDQGVGIKHMDRKRIFERYERVSESSNIGGLGLGLFITKQIVDAHMGTIEVESAPGRGSIFTVKIPMARNPQ